jgi:hypothetical protein
VQPERGDDRSMLLSVASLRVARRMLRQPGDERRQISTVVLGDR